MIDAESARMLRDAMREPPRPDVNLPKKALLKETTTVLPLSRKLIDTTGLTEAQRRRKYEAELFTDSMTVGQLVRRYSEKGLLDQIDQSNDHYHRVGRLLDLPLKKFQPRFDEYMRDLARRHNFFSDVGLVQCPGIERVYYDVKELHVRWEMLQAAADVMEDGVDSLREHKDPFGRGPLEYAAAATGFTLTSDLNVNGAPVRMHFTYGRKS
jgi:hypothetical protein